MLDEGPRGWRTLWVIPGTRRAGSGTSGTVQFVDEVEVEVAAGRGGDGCVAFRREKYRPLGGPSGGDGGDGGHVVFVADTRLGTLVDLRYRRRITARAGERGRGKDQYGKGADDVVVRVPVGTQVFDADTDEMVADLTVAEAPVVVAQGGHGGRGNIHFVTPHDRAPRRAEEGRPGETRRLRLELKLLADVGVIGFPNAGKSTFIARVSRARPKIADYPFTTLVPNLGVVRLGEERSFVIADIPGIIEGAAEGAGLGHRFLQHVERCRVLLHLVTWDPDPNRSVAADHAALLTELERFDPDLARRPQLLAISKADLPEVRDRLDDLRSHFAAEGIDRVLVVSAVTGEGVDEVLQALEAMLREHPAVAAPSRRPRRPTAAERPPDHRPHDAPGPDQDRD